MNKPVKIRIKDKTDMCQEIFIEKWAVSNKKGTYLTKFVFDTEEEATERSMCMNVTDLHRKMENAYEKLAKKYPKEYAEIYDTQSGLCTLGDLLA